MNGVGKEEKRNEIKMRSKEECGKDKDEGSKEDSEE